MRKYIVVFGFIILLTGFFESVALVSAAGASSQSFWEEGIVVNEIERIPVERLVNRGNVDCVHLDLKSRFASGYVVDDGRIVFGEDTREAEGRTYPGVCASQQDQGLVAGGFWAPDSNPANVLPVDSASYTMTQAPSGSAVLFSTPAPLHGTAYSINHSLSFVGSLDLKNRSEAGEPAEKIWKIHLDRLSEFLEYEDGGVVRIDQIGFSLNGRYMAAQFSGRGYALVDLATKELTPFSARHFSSGARTFITVSNDGKTVASYSPGRLMLHDVAGCEKRFEYGAWPSGGELTTKGCRSVNYYSDVAVRYPRTQQIARLRFSPNGASLFVDVGWREDEYVWQRLRLDARSYQKTARSYLALGDSFSSGEGDTKGGNWYEPGTDEQGDPESFAERNLCHLSRRSYPYLLALKSGYLSSNLDSPPQNGLFHSLACSGAKMHNVVGGPLGDRSSPGGAHEFAFADNQYLYVVDSPLGWWQPGAAAQVDLAERLNPEVVTVSIGGNDAGFGVKLAACLLPGVCEFATSEQKRSLVAKEIAGEYWSLVRVYQRLKQSMPEARIYVIGYPDLVQTGATPCASNVHLERLERDFVAQSTRYFNQVVAAAAQAAGVRYVDVSDILSGSNLCSTGQGFKTVNGVTAGNDSALSAVDSGLFRYGLCVFRNCIGSESFHPNQHAQPEYVKRILAVTNELTAESTPPASTLRPIPPDYFGSDAQAFVARQNAGENSIQTSPELVEMIVGALDYRAPVIELNGLLPGSGVAVEIRSTPTLLGGYSVDAVGSVRAELVLPRELEPGYHELHVSGFDTFGKKRSWYQPLLVGAHEGDFDADGVDDDRDECLVVYDSGLDVDADGIDDSCDDEVGLVDMAGDCHVTPVILQWLNVPLAGTACRAAQLERGVESVQVAERTVIVRRRSDGVPLDVARVSSEGL